MAYTYNNAGGGTANNTSTGVGRTIDDAWDAISGQDKYRIQTGQYDPTRPDEERRLALQQRAQQQELAGAIQQRALGQGGPSVAELQGQRQLGQAQAAAANQAASGRGVDRAAAFYQAQQQQGNLAAQANADTTMLRAQEQIAAQQLGTTANQGIREQDQTGRTISANEQMAQLQAQTAAEKLRADQAAANAKGKQEATGGLMTAAGGLLAMSDMRAKQDIRRVSPEDARLSAALDRIRSEQVSAIQSRENLAPVQPSTFRYKPEDAARMGTDTGLREGVMAQDLQRSPAYQAAVVPTPQGLALDKDRLLQVNTAELGGLDKRMRELEAAKGKAINRVNAPVDPEQEKLMRALDRGGAKAKKNIEGAGRPKAVAAR